MNTDDILRDRNVTHGAYDKQLPHAHGMKKMLEGMIPHAALAECANMICTKLSRIAHGSQFEKDHWQDIMGYAALGLKVIDKIEEEIQDDSDRSEASA